MERSDFIFLWYFTKTPSESHCQLQTYDTSMRAWYLLQRLGHTECALTYLLPWDAWHLRFDVSLLLRKSSTIWALSKYREGVDLSGGPSEMICWWFDFHPMEYMAAQKKNSLSTEATWWWSCGIISQMKGGNSVRNFLSQSVKFWFKCVPFLCVWCYPGKLNFTFGSSHECCSVCYSYANYCTFFIHVEEVSLDSGC